jgi:hypothetical protein
MASISLKEDQKKKKYRCRRDELVIEVSRGTLKLTRQRRKNRKKKKKEIKKTKK